MIHDTQDKKWWCLHGANFEHQFCSLLRLHFDRYAIVNPEKRANKYAPDLLVEGHLSDLKTQTTPFFKSSYYGFDPQFTATFNRKDLERYKEFYPRIHIYFWIDWQTLHYNGTQVEPMTGIFGITFPNLALLVERAPEHFYQARTQDQNGNARSSFLVDLRHLKMIFFTKGQVQYLLYERN